MNDTATFPDLATLREMRTTASSEVLANASVRKSGAGGIKGLAVQRSDAFELSPFDIHVQNGWNGRDFNDPTNIAHVEELAHSIAAQGVKTPLTVFMADDGTGHFFLSDGECRLRATLYAINVLGKPILSVPVRTEPRGSTEDERILGQLVRNTGKPFSPMEKARVIRRAIDRGWGAERIAAYVGSLTKERIGQLLALLEMPEPVRAQVAAGTVSATEAARVVKAHGEEAAQIIEQAAALPPEEGGGNKPGKATRAALEAVTSAPKAREREPEPQGEDDSAPDPLAMLEDAQRTIEALNAEIRSLTATDAGREIAALRGQLAGVNARLQQAIGERKEASDRADVAEKTLRKIRTALDVESNGYILEAIAKLKGD